MEVRLSIFLILLLCMFLPAQGKDVSVSVCDTTVLEYNYTYDSWGRPLTTTLAVNGGSAVTIENNTYDNYGRLASTSHGNATKATTAYAYNIRDWITQISSTAFTEQLYYNTSHNGSTPQWGGNISAIAWQTAADSQSSKARGYNFTYDGVSRLTAANYFENNQSSGKYSTAYDYDAMSNITALHRNGLLDDGEYGTIDHLTYEYEGNQLIKVTDSNEEEPTYAHAMHFTDGADEEVEYEYNANGATTKDENKGIEVEYNALNLPQKITHRFGQYTNYLYSADGKRLRTEYYPTPAVLQPRIIGYDDWGFPIFGPPPAPTPSITRDYCGPFIYENNALKRILFNGGYITFCANSNQPEYHYYVKDHLGNIPAVINENDSIEEINHYYPYGALFGESTGLANSVQPYKYSGKELDRMHGLDMYDYGARLYDPVIAWWGKMDNLSEDYYPYSPYNYGLLNPINNFDIKGLYPKNFIVLHKRPLHLSSYYTFTPSAAYLLSLVSGVSQEKIESSYIFERDIIHPYPLYRDPYYGGVTLPHGNGYSITYTNNLFDDNRLGQDYDAWLDISSHEVGHIKHIDKIRAGKEENSSFQLLSYLSMFLCSYISEGGHDESSLEKEANKGSERYKDFKSFVETEYGKDSINSLFEKEISEEERIKNISIWWEDYKNKD